MTGVVKEEILTRQAELGLIVQDGRLVFDLCLLDRDELLPNHATFSWMDVTGQGKTLGLPSSSLAYTICQVPVVLQLASENCIRIFFSDGSQQTMVGHILDLDNSRHIFQRDGAVHHLEVYFSDKE